MAPTASHGRRLLFAQSGSADVVVGTSHRHRRRSRLRSDPGHPILKRMLSAQSTDRAVGRPVRVAALAAIAGGVAWIVKAGAILVTGDQPPVAFGLGPPLFAVGLLGLYAALGRAEAQAKAGAGAAILAIALMCVIAVAAAVEPSLVPSGEEVTVLSAVQMAAALCLLAALVLLGLAGRRARRAPWAAMPLWMGILVVPGLLAGGALSAIDERLLEIPLVLFALAWIALGYSMWRTAAPNPGPP
jgi:hypothetical protein